MKKVLLIGALLLCPQKGFSHPVPYQGAIGVMTWNQPLLSDDWITYSFRHDMAVAARHMRIDMPDGRMHFYGPQFNYLVKRWNLPDAQANVYVYGSYGAMSFLNQTVGAGLAGFEADIEDRRLYASLKHEKMWDRNKTNFYHASARVGAAPYAAEFNEIAAWVMLQYDYHPQLSKKFELTPLVRLFYRSVLLEVGVSTQADWMLNFMFHF